MNRFYSHLQEAVARPAPFEVCSARELWTDEHIARQMLSLHLDDTVEACSRSSAFMDRSAEWISSFFDVGPDTRIADFGCGPGHYTRRLARRGARVTGIDFSASSLAYARAAAADEGLAIAYVCQDYLTYWADARFDLILLIMRDYCALSPTQRRALLGVFRSSLRPQGKLLLDVFSRVAFAGRKEGCEFEWNPQGGFWSASPHHVLHYSFRYEAEAVVLDKYTIIEPNRTRVVHNWLQYFDPDQLSAELGEVGFTVEHLPGNVAGDAFDPAADEFAVVACPC